MASANFVLMGEKELRRTLGQLSWEHTVPIVRKALTAASEPIVQAAKDNIRSKDLMHSGNLLGSITARIRNYRANKNMIAVVGPSWPEGAHGHLVEFGTGPRWKGTASTVFARLFKGKQARGYTGVMPATPFLEPAFNAHKDSALRRLQSIIKDGIDRAVRQGASRLFTDSGEVIK